MAKDAMLALYSLGFAMLGFFIVKQTEFSMLGKIIVYSSVTLGAYFVFRGGINKFRSNRG